MLENTAKAHKLYVYSDANIGKVIGRAMLKSGEIRNNVICGEGGYLFLHGGNHSVIDYFTGAISPPKESINQYKKISFRGGAGPPSERYFTCI